MPLRKLKQYLDDNGVRYMTITHSPSYTAQEIAASAHVPGKEMAKAVMVKIDGKLAMAVTPAPSKVDFDKLKELAGAAGAELATEDEFKDLFPNCEVGAMPPFGNLYDMDVYAASDLAEDESIAFNAGSHSELIRLDYADFDRLVHPKTGRFAVQA